MDGHAVCRFGFGAMRLRGSGLGVGLEGVLPEAVVVIVVVDGCIDCWLVMEIVTLYRLLLLCGSMK